MQPDNIIIPPVQPQPVQPVQTIPTIPTVQITTPAATSAQPQGQYIYASFRNRLIAVLVDGLVLFAICFPINLVLVLMGTHIFTQLIPFVIVGYNIYFTGKFGQTLGKKAMKIKVVEVGTNDVVGYKKAFLRELGKIPSSMIFYLGYLWMLWDSQKQTWHDKIAGTVVVKV